MYSYEFSFHRLSSTLIATFYVLFSQSCDNIDLTGRINTSVKYIVHNLRDISSFK